MTATLRMLAPMDGTEEQNPDAVDASEYPRPATSAAGSLAKIIVYGIGGVVLIVMMASDALSVTTTEEIVGFILVSVGLFELVIALIRYHELKYLVPPVMAVTTGTILLLWPNETLQVTGVALGVLVLARGLFDIWSAFLRWHNAGTNSWVLIRGLLGVRRRARCTRLPERVSRDPLHPRRYHRGAQGDHHDLVRSVPPATPPRHWIRLTPAESSRTG